MEEDFEFDMSVPRYRINDERLINSLQRFADKRNFKYFSAKEFDSWDGKVAWSTTYVRRFGNWPNVLKQTGINIEGIRKREYDSKELIEHLKECWKTLGHYPSDREFNKYNKKLGLTLSVGPYIARWGSVYNACQRIADHHIGKITEEELYTPLKKSGKPTIPLSLRYDVLKKR